jgi:arylsulfatase A-like enzyme
VIPRFAAASLLVWFLLVGNPGTMAGQRRVDQPASRPRLVVVIAVDQLRADYIDRFRSWFGPAGFNLFLEHGARFVTARHEHAITETCPGHAVMLTGSYGMVNGIVANDWYDARSKRAMYCAEDTTVTLIGSGETGRSPRNLIAGTVGDMLKTQTAGHGRVITVSAKDRSAIMLGGKRADAAYWPVDSTFVTSTYYRPDLPAWVRAFNASRAVARYVGQGWDRALPRAAYAPMGADDVRYERNVAGLGRTFPHPIASAQAVDYTPFSDEIVAEFARRAVTAESLGRDSVPDLLGIGFSATDRVGHTFGPNSQEIMDDVVRLDRTLARLFGFLNREVGLDKVLLVLTADHGVAPFPELVARSGRRPGPGRLDPATVDSAVSRALSKRYGSVPSPGWLAYDGGSWLSLSRPAVSGRRATLGDAVGIAREAIRRLPGIYDVRTAEELERQRAAAVARGPAGDAVRSYYPGRGGDLIYLLRPDWIVSDEPTGTTHGSGWRYDQDVPLLWYGRGVVAGTYRDTVAVADLAPTLSALLGLPAPSGAQGRVLNEMLR